MGCYWENVRRPGRSDWYNTTLFNIYFFTGTAGAFTPIAARAAFPRVLLGCIGVLSVRNLLNFKMMARSVGKAGEGQVLRYDIRHTKPSYSDSLHVSGLRCVL